MTDCRLEGGSAVDAGRRRISVCFFSPFLYFFFRFGSTSLDVDGPPSGPPPPPSCPGSDICMCVYVYVVPLYIRYMGLYMFG